MKTLEEFETALVNHEKVFVGDGFFLVRFYAGNCSPICGLTSVFVEISVPIDFSSGLDTRFFDFPSHFTSMGAYLLYRSLCEKFNVRLNF